MSLYWITFAKTGNPNNAQYLPANWPLYTVENDEVLRLDTKSDRGVHIQSGLRKKQCDFQLPEANEYAVGMLFLPNKINQSNYCIKIFEEEIIKQELEIIGWRDVPVNSKVVGSIAGKTQPTIKQVFIRPKDSKLNDKEKISISLFLFIMASP